MRSGVGRGVPVVVVLMATLVVAAVPAWAQPSVTTRYPAVDVAAGEQVEFALSVAASPGERVALEVVEAPEGWETALRAGGFNVRAVTPEAGEATDVTLDVTVPPDAAGGGHEVVARASSDEGTDVLTLDLRVTEAATSALSLTTEFSTLRGGAEDTFNYSVTLANDIPEETTFAMTSSGPEGWQVSANPSTQSRANTVTVAAGGSATISVEATPPPGVTAGEYPIVLQVTGGGRTAQMELIAEVTGSPGLSLSTATERLNASGTAGETTAVDLLVTNDGSAPLTGVELSATPPSDWEVTFEPAVLDVVPPGETATVRALITPTGEAVVGDYVVTLTAASDQQRDQIEVRFAVGTSGAWGVAAVAVILLVVLALGEVFRRYGRR